MTVRKKEVPAERPLGPLATPEVPASLVGARRDVLEHLAAEAGRSRTVEELAATLALHHNSVRAALAALVDEGLVAVDSDAPAGRGRPANLYSATVAARSMLAVEASSGGNEYRMLAEAFAVHLARRADAAGQARDVGALWGASVAGRRPHPKSAARRRGAVLDILTDLGFGPEPGAGEQVHLRTCPILASARANPEVICSVHHGLVEGARAELGAADGEVGLEPFAMPGACRLRLPR